MTEKTFEAGDLVRHRASGEQAVVINVMVEPCRAPGHEGPVGCLKHKFEGCVEEPTGDYEVSWGFGRTERVSGYLLEAAGGLGKYGAAMKAVLELAGDERCHLLGEFCRGCNRQRSG